MPDATVLRYVLEEQLPDPEPAIVATH